MYKRTKGQVISDALCGILMLISVLVFILVGILAHIWHPTWIVMPCTGIVCGIISIAVNTYANLTRKEDTEKKKEEK